MYKAIKVFPRPHSNILIVWYIYLPRQKKKLVEIKTQTKNEIVPYCTSIAITIPRKTEIQKKTGF